MYKSKKLILLFIFSITLLTLQGCGGITDYFEELFDPSLMIVRGIETISGDGEVYTIPAGTTVKFKGSGQFLFGNGYANAGQLVITNGATLIADGEVERIVFELAGGGRGIILEENASNESMIIYCEFRNVCCLEICNSSVTIKYNKFIESSGIDLYLNSSPSIEYNTFDNSAGMSNVYAISSSPINVREPTVSPIISYNNIANYYQGICLLWSNNATISNNNITNCEFYAIGYGGVISNNYIANCKGLSVVDTTGEQCDGTTYQNPQTMPVPEAGCGW